MSSALRVAVIGAGGFAEICHVPGINSHPEAEVVLLCGRRGDRARAMADRLGVPEVCTDFSDACSRPDIDAVTICTPNAAHCAQALAALDRGKHVFCEKPLAMSVVEAEEMTHAAGAAGVVNVVAFTFRYTHPLRRLREELHAGRVGEPYLIRMSFEGWGGVAPGARAGWRERSALAGGGVLFDMGSHLFDTARFLLGEVREVSGWTVNIPRVQPDRGAGEPVLVDTDDIAGAAFLCGPGPGIRGEWLMSRATPAPAENGFVLVVGREGALRASLSRGQRDSLQFCPPGGAWEALPLPSAGPAGEPYALGLMMRAFVDACLRGSAGPLDAGFADGLAVQRALADVAAASARLPEEKAGHRRDQAVEQDR